MSAERPRILFVDDDPQILAGLKNLLFRDRRRWDVAFASSGEEALAGFDAAIPDIVITDMCMPGMDGAELLTHLKDRSPATARIMLSGHADRDSIVRALPALQFLLSKPCDAATLRRTIEGVLTGVIAAAPLEVRHAIGARERLPSPPAILRELAAVLAHPGSTVLDVTRIAVRDPGIAAKLLQLVNSAYFGAGCPTSSIERAVRLLGVELLRYIASVTTLFAATEPSGPALDRACAQAVQRAERAKAGAGASGLDPEEVYAAALLVDIGALVVPGDAHHAVAGGILAQLWGLPPGIIATIRYHHDPAQAPPEHAALVRAASAGDG